MKLLTVLFTLTVFIFPSLASTKLSKQIDTINSPISIDRVAPKYPINAARAGTEGWTRASFVIDTDGSVKDIVIMDYEGSRDFKKESIRALRKWKYQPAKENGEAVQSCNNTVQLDFRMGKGSSGTISKKFKNKYVLAKEYLNDKNLPMAKQTIKEIESFKSINISERSFLAIIKADYAKQNNQPKLQLNYINRINLDALSDKTKLYWLNQKLILEANQFKLAKAIETYNKIIKLDVAKPYLSALQNTYTQIKALIADNELILINAKVSKHGSWLHKLARNDFSISNIQGNLHKLEVRCANKRHIFTVETDNTWKIPKSWRGCSVVAYSDNEATFDLIEHPFEKITTAAIN